MFLHLTMEPNSWYVRLKPIVFSIESNSKYPMDEQNSVRKNSGFMRGYALGTIGRVKLRLLYLCNINLVENDESRVFIYSISKIS